MLGKEATFKIPTHPVWQFDPAITARQPEGSAHASASSSSSSSVSSSVSVKAQEQTQDKAFSLIPAGSVDIAQVREAYDHHAVEGYDIASIDIVDNPGLQGAFSNYLSILNAREGNHRYEPSWRQSEERSTLAFREEAVALYQRLSAPYQSAQYPHVHLLPMWHGTYDDVANHIFSGGYGIFRSNAHRTDEGYFGQGIYSTYEADYGFRCYAEPFGEAGVLLFNWMSFYSAYPVIGGDMPKVQGKVGGIEQCDAHFVPVRADAHPHTAEYFPCYQGEIHQYIEMVVFNEAQCLPRYRVKLTRQRVDRPLSLPFAESQYASGLNALKNSDYTTARQWFEQAASRGCLPAHIRLHWLAVGATGMLALDSATLPALTTSAAQHVAMLLPYVSPMTMNHPEAQFLAGWCYANGLGVEQQPAQAAEYYWLAARKGHGEAATELARCCSTGQGVEKDFTQAVTYYKKAASLDSVEACYALFVAYSMGLGDIAPDLLLATQYQTKATTAGYPDSLQEAKACFDKGVAYEKQTAYQAAAIEYHKAVDKGHAKAGTHLGTFFLAGRGNCTQDAAKAYRLYKRSAEAGDVKAMKNVSVLLRKGIGVEQNEQAAQRWVEQVQRAAGSLAP